MSGGGRPPVEDWGALWAPYDEATYRAALAYIQPGWVVLDIGAGDLRFARRVAAMGCRVYAVERQPDVGWQGLKRGLPPARLSIVIADARQWPFPSGLDAAVLLMRHCADYALYVRRLREAGCPRLITNARWRMGVEEIPLAPARPFREGRIGWYACVRCGQVGFIPGDPDDLTPEVINSYNNVEGCPACMPAPPRESYLATDTLHPEGSYDRNRYRLA